MLEFVKVTTRRAAGRRRAVRPYLLPRTRRDVDEDAVLAWAEAILWRRLQRRGRLDNPLQAEHYLRLRLAGLLREELHAVWLDGHHRIIACDVLAKGALDRAQVEPRVVVQCALQRNARQTILAHNHHDSEGCDPPRASRAN